MSMFWKAVLIICSLGVLCIIFGLTSSRGTDHEQSAVAAPNGSLTPMPTPPVGTMPGPVGTPSTDTHPSPLPVDSPKTPVPTVNPHIEQLAELRQKREGIEIAMAIELEFTKKMLREPGGIANVPDDEHERMTKLMAEKNAIDAEIQREEQEMAASDSPITPVTVPPDPKPTSALSDDERKRLTDQRRYDMDLITTTEAMLSDLAFPYRVEAYCQFTVNQTELLIGTDPSKQIRDFAHKANVDRCKGMIISGIQLLPSQDFFREKAAKARQDLYEIEKKLGPIGN
jgi:hypothetical protein